MKLKKTYPGFCLDGELCLQPGRITGLVGRNGSGKTTIFQLMLGLIKNEEDDTPLDKKKTAVVWNDAFFSGYFTWKDVCILLKNSYETFDGNVFYRYVDHFQLPKTKQIRDYSTGMLAKLKVISAISTRAKILLLDEPTSGLDVLARHEVLDLLRDYMEEDESRSILISSHISSDLETLCDDFYLIENGQILLHEETDVILDSYAVLGLGLEQWEQLDRTYLLKRKGLEVLTNQKQFYAENYPQIFIKQGNIDTVLEWMVEGEDV